MKPLPILVASVTFLISCGSPTRQDSTAQIINNEENTAVNDLTDHPGYSLYKMYCIACHGNMAKPEQRLAPPAFMVSKRYHQFFNNKEDFTKRVVSWVNNPTKEEAMLPGAVRNFDVMPALQLSLEDRQKIADYFYETSFEEPVWMEAHMKEEHKNGNMMMDSLTN